MPRRRRRKRGSATQSSSFIDVFKEGVGKGKQPSFVQHVLRHVRWFYSHFHEPIDVLAGLLVLVFDVLIFLAFYCLAVVLSLILRFYGWLRGLALQDRELHQHPSGHHVCYEQQQQQQQQQQERGVGRDVRDSGNPNAGVEDHDMFISVDPGSAIPGAGVKRRHSSILKLPSDSSSFPDQAFSGIWKRPDSERRRLRGASGAAGGNRYGDVHPGEVALYLLRMLAAWIMANVVPFFQLLLIMILSRARRGDVRPSPRSSSDVIIVSPATAGGGGGGGGGGGRRRSETASGSKGGEGARGGGLPPAPGPPRGGAGGKGGTPKNKPSRKGLEDESDLIPDDDEGVSFGAIMDKVSSIFGRSSQTQTRRTSAN